MSVNGISPTSTNSYDSPFADRRQKLDALRDALDSGDLQSAQAAFAALNPSSTTGAAPASSAKTQFGSDLQAIGQALDAGDLGAAQKAFAAMRQHRHHGAHHHSAPSTDQSTTTPDVPATADNVGTSLNVIA
ncbi:MAG TPA: hypothetical protein VF456_08480 [Vicinamibacterales bacterium]